MALGVDSEPVEVEFCDPRVEFTYTSRSRFSPWVLSILSSYIEFKLRQVRVDFGPTEVVFWPLGVDFGRRFGFTRWESLMDL